MLRSPTVPPHRRRPARRPPPGPSRPGGPGGDPGPPPARPGRRLGSATPLVAVLLLVLAGCGTSGRDLREPNRQAVAPTRSTEAATSSSYPPTSLQLVASGFAPGAAIPAPYACGGRPPALRWTGVPAGTAEIALALVDFDEADETARIHWLVAGLAVTGTEGMLPDGGRLPAGAVTLANGTGGTGYDGPCPKPGGAHTVNFMVLALPGPSGLTAATPPAEALRQLQGLAKGDIAYYTGTV